MKSDSKNFSTFEVLRAKALLRLIISLIIFQGCSVEEVVERPYPRLRTLPVSNISKDQAVFSAEVIYRGSSEVLEYGFIWSLYKEPSSTLAEKYTVQGDPPNFFSATVSSLFIKDKRYFIKPFVRTSDYLVYGRSVTFRAL